MKKLKNLSFLVITLRLITLTMAQNYRDDNELAVVNEDVRPSADSSSQNQA